MDKEMFENYKAEFNKRGHKATILLNNDKFLILDWKKAKGGSDYSVRYIFDKEKGNIIVTGDLGDCVASWFNPLDIEDVARFMLNIEYYIGKFQCSSDKYTYRYKDIHDDWYDYKKEWFQDIMNDEDEKWDFDEFEESLLDWLYNGARGCFPEEVTSFMEEHGFDDWQEELLAIGRRIDSRIYLWAVGFNMALKELNIL